MKRWLIGLVVTPTRVRRVIAAVVSWFLQDCLTKKAWDVVSAFPVWLRCLADFIDKWNEAELTEDKDILITDLVRHALTDEAIERLVDRLAALEHAGRAAGGVKAEQLELWKEGATCPSK